MGDFCKFSNHLINRWVPEMTQVDLNVKLWFSRKDLWTFLHCCVRFWKREVAGEPRRGQGHDDAAPGQVNIPKFGGKISPAASPS